jgi:hypothetical protein
MTLLYIDELLAFLWIGATIGAVVIFGRFRDAATLLLLIGAAGFTGWQVSEACYHYDVIKRLINPYVHVLDVLEFVWRFLATCFPVGFICFAIRVTQRT